jgi:hypothetical protein
MSFQPDKSKLENEFDVLKQQASSTCESWDDPVQRRFYEQFVNSLPKEFVVYTNAINKLDKLFETAEQHINNLQQ